MIDARTIDLYAAHPESVPPELASRPMRDRRGRRLAVGDEVTIDGVRLRIVGRDGGWIDLVDSRGEPDVRFVTELREEAVRVAKK